MKTNQKYQSDLERIRQQFIAGHNPTELMNQLERTYHIPLLNNESWNQEHPEIIELYREISDSREL